MLIQNLFYGEIQNEIHCQECQEKKIIKEKVMDLNLSFNGETPI